MTARAVDLLMSDEEPPGGPAVLLEPRLTVRASTAPAA
jgi:hypothetical protein